MLSSNIKIENLAEAIEIMSKYDIFYNIERGMIFDKECYWINFEKEPKCNVVIIIRKIAHLSQD